MSQAFLSWMELWKHNVLGETGKVAALLFDKVILQLPRDGMMGEILDNLVVARELSAGTADAMATFFLPVHNYLAGYRYVASPWQHENSELVSAVEDTVFDYVKARMEPGPAYEGAFVHELAMIGCGLLDGIDCWIKLSRDQDCTIMAGPLEHRVIQQALVTRPHLSEAQPFGDALLDRFPSLSATSWDRIVELRHSAFLESFREKIGKLQACYVSGDAVLAKSLLRDAEETDIGRLIRSVKPSPRAALLKGILSNVPLPLPVNPISLVLAGKDLRDSYVRARNFGWLFFLQELHEE